MLGGVATLTWRRPKLVLAVVGVFVLVAGVFGHDVERHLKAAGFTDSASQSERATALLRSELGYDASPAIVVVVRNRGGGKLDLTTAEMIAFPILTLLLLLVFRGAVAAAGLIDTTIVRALLVPALMGIFGEWNWWAPGPLRRLQMRLRFAGG